MLDIDSLENIWSYWRDWRGSIVITIEPCADLDEAIALYL